MILSIFSSGEAGGGKTNLLRLIALYLTHNPNIRLFIIDARETGFLRLLLVCLQAEGSPENGRLFSWEMDRRYDIFDKWK